MARNLTTFRSSQPIGVVLAGGLGLRIGGGKPTVALRGQPLLLYPVSAMKLAFSEVAVIAKAETALPPTEGAMVWIEPELPVNPLFGICEALRLAGGRPVTVCPTDLPFVTTETLLALSAASTHDAPAVIASCRGVTRPLLGCYQSAAVPLLEQAALNGTPPEDVARALRATPFEIENENELFDIDTPDDLLQASAMLDVRSPTRT